MNATPHSGRPLVSIIVRSMGRPLLHDTVESILRQEYAPVEVVVVDATGGSHPALPASWIARGALVAGDRERARILSDEIFAKYEIRFALEPGEGGELA